MAQRFPCASCFVSLSENQPVCPNCGAKNPHYDPSAKRSRAQERILARAKGLHHPSATIGACAYCDSEVWSDEKVCSRCGAPNPNFVVHPDSDGSNVTRSGAAKEHGRENASTGKCPYCNATVRSNEPVCPNCGSENPHYIEDTVRVIINPTTIEELKEYCAERDMPLLRMRFFIGEDYRGPRAFGIYKDGTGNVIVYKNKDNGSRAVRYQGPDEKHAVREIHQKLLEECRARGINPDQSLNEAYQKSGYRPGYDTRSQQGTPDKPARSSSRWSSLIKVLLFIFVMMVLLYGFTQCTRACIAGELSSGSGYSYSYDGGNSWNSGSSSSWWDSDDDYDWDSGSSWDSWDSGSSDWSSDW